MLASCTPKPPPPPGPVQFVVGDPYQAMGEWLYPKSFGSYDVTGLAEISDSSHAAYTTDNEAYDANGLTAASPLLQLPAVVTVTNLVNGYTMDVRVNDRGPGNPGRVLSVTPHVAKMLGFPPDGVVEVEVVLNAQATGALDAALGQGPKLAADPEAGITAQSLGAPGSANGGPAQDLTPQDTSAASAAPSQLSGTVTAVPPSPGPLYVQIPGFGRPRDTDDTLAALADLQPMVTPVFGGDRTFYSVRIGPYHAVADADAALQQVLQRGVVNPEIIVR